MDPNHTTDVGRYTVLAFALTWILVGPIGASAMGWTRFHIPGGWHTIGAAGPVLAALTVARKRPGGAASLIDGWSRWRAHPMLYLAALSPLLFLLPSALIVRLQEGAWPDTGLLFVSERLTGTGWVLGMVLPALAYAAGEETGWRGFALPRLQARFSPMLATLVLATIWVAWHAPFYLYRPGMAGSSVGEIIGQAVVIGVGAYFLTWLYNSTGGSIALVAVWHFSHSIVHIATPEISISWDTWNGVLTTILAILVTVIWRHRLSTGQTITASGTAEAGTA